jgi:transposase
MMGRQSEQKELFSYAVDLDRRVRAGNPLRRIRERIDFGFVREEVKGCYGYNGNVSEDPAVIVKMMFLLFYDDVTSERELMRIIAERLDYLWFLGYGLDEEIPDHSVLSKARARWGSGVFERLFVRVVQQCVTAGLVDGKKLHVDAGLTRMGSGQSRPRYHHHRVVDNAQGVITAVETTSGSIAENKRLLGLVEQHETNTGKAADTVVADSKYGTTENYVACQQQGITTHMGDVLAKQTNNPRRQGIFPDSEFQYQAATNTYRCPAGVTMTARRLHPRRRTWEYHTARGVCGACALRSECTRASYGRTIHRHEHQDLLDRGRAQARSPGAYRDRRRRKHLAEGSFADAANNHHFKRSRWRRLWRQQIQDYLIATIQNVKILLRSRVRRVAAAASAMTAQGAHFFRLLRLLACRWWGAIFFGRLMPPQPHLARS